MARRTVYGYDYSENGWPMVDQGSCEWVSIPGTSVTLQIQSGQPVAVLRAFAADFNAYIEPLRDPDSACWTPTNSVATSNHLSGTACDFNWNTHPFQVDYAGFSPAQIATARELLDFYEQTVFWGQDWNTPKDAMHWQMGYNTYQNPHTADFIARKIRADGFSTFRRGSQSATPSAVNVLAAATGLSVGRATEILGPVREGLQAASCTNVNRIAMWLAQIGHESDGFNATEEYKKDGRYAPYIGRTWIQITWDYNYRAFSEWMFDRGLVPTPDYFVVNYQALADLQWAGIGAAWYWTEERPMNDLVDAGNSASWNGYKGFEAVTAAINGGTNGLADRRERYNLALLQGDALLQLLNEQDDFLSALSDAEQRELLDLCRQQASIRRKSLSPLRWPYEKEVNTCAGFAWTADGNVHVMLVEKLAVDYGDPQAVALLLAVSETDEPGREADSKLAKAILDKVDEDAFAAATKWLDEHNAN
ncbi:M15 family metallopeptidase [Mycobacteroides abscessus]|uniref:M15 family metallopeptidase n=1 Tax=Mycobacteroides abscessus TaxID=36809 RepID=UPI00092BCBBF|nr:M15 family metallopeptidase [Mycobacteroides abscessus]SIG00098.1 putative secreted chitinase [Mycobacteroides abscessus subsp. abscessus]SKW94175.1 putative secreted chitinase [Mycobacteroides abscessus subsp. abscessus]SKX63439.1 putative secreted chitinase [Mycobacteroides abscessus subsp. abscessus]SKZ18024.1 putative secreted chitinase [Mycobacteroides abscessus subsp. abscessus]SKZ29582.1 putative secreted chitinase [Mycobacteroides abscessus subsp. abscessus]